MQSAIQVFITILMSVLLFSCINYSGDTEYANLKCLGETSEQQLTIVVVDSIFVDGRGTSLDGLWSVIDNKLCYADEHIVRVLMFDTLGKQTNKLFAKGRGPLEFIMPALSFMQLSNGKFLYTDKNQNLFKLSYSPEYITEKHTNIIKAGLPDNNVGNFMNSLLTSPDPNIYAMYELCFQGRDIIEYISFALIMQLIVKTALKIQIL